MNTEEKNMGCPKIFLFLLISLFLIPVSTLSATAQSDQQTSAELSIYPIGQVPMIEPNKEVTINLSYYDNFGMNWTYLKDAGTGLLKVYYKIMTRIWWPLIHPAWKALFGYTSVSFNAEIVGNPQGWVSSISPTTIGQSTDGTQAILHLKVRVTDSSILNTVIVRVSATRFTKDGNEYGTSFFDIPVRSAKLNSLQISPDQNSKEEAPASMTTFTFSITNLGYFRDTFAVKINSTDKINAVLSESSFVLEPGMTKQVTLWVMTPEVFFDPGTAHIINVSAYSLKYPTKFFSSGVTVVTKGTYISPFIVFIIGVIMVLIVFIYFVFFYLRAKRERDVYGKPEKPWNIPEEKVYLQDLKQDDKKAYEQERLMMEDEYKSAMLWYKRYRAVMKQKPKTEKPQPKEKPKKRIPSLLKKPEEKPQVEKVASIVPVEDKSKQKALAKIQSEQEKQLRKMKEK